MNVIEGGEDLGDTVDDSDGVLEVSRGLAVASATGPAIVLDDDVAGAEVDHRLDADAHAVAYDSAGAGATIVGDLGAFVHAATDAVTTHFADYGVAATLAVGLNLSLIHI